MMKRVLALIMLLGMILGIAGCGQEVTQDDIQSILNASSEPEDVSTTEDIVEETKEPIKETPEIDQTQLPIEDLGPDADPHLFTGVQLEAIEMIPDWGLALYQETGELNDEYFDRWLKVSEIEVWDSNDEFTSIKSSSYINYYFDNEADYNRCFDGGEVTLIGYCTSSGDYYRLDHCIFIESSDPYYEYGAEEGPNIAVSDPTGPWGHEFKVVYTEEEMSRALDMTNNVTYQEYFADMPGFVANNVGRLIYLGRPFYVWNYFYEDYTNVMIGYGNGLNPIYADCYGDPDDIDNLGCATYFDIYGILQANEKGKIVLKDCQFIPIE